MIKRFITSNSGNTMDAEDIFQDALIAIHLKPRLELTCKFSTYLYEVCRRLWLTHLNSRIFEVEYNEDYREEPDDRLERIINAFDKLSPKRQQVLLLSLNMPLSEVAEIMGCTYKSVKVKKYKALKQLRNNVNES